MDTKRLEEVIALNFYNDITKWAIGAPERDLLAKPWDFDVLSLDVEDSTIFTLSQEPLLLQNGPWEVETWGLSNIKPPLPTPLILDLRPLCKKTGASNLTLRHSTAWVPDPDDCHSHLSLQGQAMCTGGTPGREDAQSIMDRPELALNYLVRGERTERA